MRIIYQLYMFQVIKIENDGQKGNPFILDLEGLNTLLKMATPFKCSFEIKKVDKN